MLLLVELQTLRLYQLPNQTMYIVCIGAETNQTKVTIRVNSNFCHNTENTLNIVPRFQCGLGRLLTLAVKDWK